MKWIRIIIKKIILFILLSLLAITLIKSITCIARGYVWCKLTPEDVSKCEEIAEEIYKNKNYNVIENYVSYQTEIKSLDSHNREIIVTKWEYENKIIYKFDEEDGLKNYVIKKNYSCIIRHFLTECLVYEMFISPLVVIAAIIVAISEERKEKKLAS